MANSTIVNSIVSAMQSTGKTTLDKSVIETICKGMEREERTMALQAAKAIFKTRKLADQYNAFTENNVTIRIPSTTTPVALKPVVISWNETICTKDDYGCIEHQFIVLNVPSTQIALCVTMGKDGHMVSRAVRAGSISSSESAKSASNREMKGFQLDKMGKSLETSCNAMLYGLDHDALLKACFRSSKLAMKDVKALNVDMMKAFGLDEGKVKAAQSVARACKVTWKKADKKETANA